MANIHPLLERELDELTLVLIHCNGIWHGELHEKDTNDPIWRSRGEYNRDAVEKSASDFATYQNVKVVTL